TLDAAFGTGGIAVTPDLGDVAGVAVARDGRPVMAGSAIAGGDTAIALARYTADGKLDATFGDAGVVTTLVGSEVIGARTDRARAIALQADGKIVVAATSANGHGTDVVVLRYLADGVPHPTTTTTTTTLPPAGCAFDARTRSRRLRQIVRALGRKVFL